jgi:hypothetical protein
MENVFLNIKDFDNYFINSDGKIKNKKGQLLKVEISKEGYYRVTLSKDGKCVKYLLHRIVAIQFIPNPENKPQVNHKNGIKSDNRVENLEWCTRSENEKHAHKNGLKNHKGEKHPSCKLTENDVIEIRKLYSEKRFTQKQLAEKFNVCFQNISLIVLRKKWNHI